MKQQFTRLDAYRKGPMMPCAALCLGCESLTSEAVDGGCDYRWHWSVEANGPMPIEIVMDVLIVRTSSLGPSVELTTVRRGGYLPRLQRPSCLLYPIGQGLLATRPIKFTAR
jgi:hypothetical protein